MKPRNFPGRKAARKLRVEQPSTIQRDWRPGKGARTSADPTVKDMCWRIGAARRGPDGVAR